MIFKIELTDAGDIISEITGNEKQLVHVLAKIMRADINVKRLFQTALDKVSTQEVLRNLDNFPKSEFDSSKENATEETTEVKDGRVSLSEDEQKLVDSAIQSITSRLFPKCPDCNQHHPQ